MVPQPKEHFRHQHHDKVNATNEQIRDAIRDLIVELEAARHEIKAGYETNRTQNEKEAGKQYTMQWWSVVISSILGVLTLIVLFRTWQAANDAGSIAATQTGIARQALMTERNPIIYATETSIVRFIPQNTVEIDVTYVNRGRFDATGFGIFGKVVFGEQPPARLNVSQDMNPTDLVPDKPDTAKLLSDKILTKDQYDAIISHKLNMFVVGAVMYENLVVRGTIETKVFCGQYDPSVVGDITGCAAPVPVGPDGRPLTMDQVMPLGRDVNPPLPEPHGPVIWH